MNLLLDESIPIRLKRELSEHEVVTVAEAGWAGKSNGELLQLAAGSFDVFITADQNLEHQQNLDKYDVAVIILVGRTNRFDDLRPLIPKVLGTLRELPMAKLLHITG